MRFLRVFFLLTVMVIITIGCSSNEVNEQTTENVVNNIEQDREFIFDKEGFLHMIHEYTIGEINISELLIDYEATNICGFNASIDENKYIQKMNISFISDIDKVERLIVYRRENNYVNLIEYEKVDYLYLNDNSNSIKIFENLALGMHEIMNAEGTIEFELASPNSIDITLHKGDIYDGKLIDEDTEVSGITYYVYEIPVVANNLKTIVYSKDKFEH